MAWRNICRRLFAMFLCVVCVCGCAGVFPVLPAVAAQPSDGAAEPVDGAAETQQASDADEAKASDATEVPDTAETPETSTSDADRPNTDQPNAVDRDGDASATDEKKPNAYGPDNLLDPNLLPDSSFIYDVSISDLGGADSYYNNQTVQVTGEAVGDNIRANISGTNRWILLQATDPTNGTYPNVTVFMSREAASRIEHFGMYSERGDIVQVRGTFHLVCPQHEGLTDLHAEYVNVVQRGSAIERPFKSGSFVPGVVLIGIGIVLVIVFGRLRERLR